MALGRAGGLLLILSLPPLPALRARCLQTTNESVALSRMSAARTRRRNPATSNPAAFRASGCYEMDADFVAQMVRALCLGLERWPEGCSREQCAQKREFCYGYD
jgi:hypothetical protein